MEATKFPQTIASHPHSPGPGSVPHEPTAPRQRSTPPMAINYRRMSSPIMEPYTKKSAGLESKSPQSSINVHYIARCPLYRQRLTYAAIGPKHVLRLLDALAPSWSGLGRSLTTTERERPGKNRSYGVLKITVACVLAISSEERRQGRSHTETFVPGKNPNAGSTVAPNSSYAFKPGYPHRLQAAKITAGNRTIGPHPRESDVR